MSLNILISNDDGYDAPGIQALASEFQSFGQVTVVAPDGNRSGASNSITLSRDIAVHHRGENLYSVEGTPADCMQVAFSGLTGGKPDVVISGINNGPNMGDDTLYSGTVAAAMEGRFLRLPPIAVSMASFFPTHYDTAARVTSDLLASFLADTLKDDFAAFCKGPTRPVLNLNVPDLAYSDLAGLKFTRLGSRFPAAGATLEGQQDGIDIYRIGPAGEINNRSEGTDFHAVENGFVSVTPLCTDMTFQDRLSGLGQLLPDFLSRKN